MGRCNGRARTVRLSWPHCALSIVICGLARTSISGPADPVGKRIGAAICAYVLATGPLALRGSVRAHVELTRNTPLQIQLYVIFFALPDLGLCLDANHAARVIDLGAYATETLRPGAPVEVVVLLRKRTALGYLLEPLTNQLWRSGSGQ